MSCTEDKGVALKYAASKKKAAIVFEVKQGMVDRGADVAWLSQYPHEKEITFQPLSAICVEGTRVQGNTLVIEARLNVNLTSLTIEQEVAKMKLAHEAMISST